MKKRTISILTTIIALILIVSVIAFVSIKGGDYIKQQQIKIDCRSDFAEQYCLQVNSKLGRVYVNYEFTCVDINKRIAKNIRYKLLQSEIDHCDNQEAKQ